jgi:hypothetical protein
MKNRAALPNRVRCVGTFTACDFYADCFEITMQCNHSANFTATVWCEPTPQIAAILLLTLYISSLQATQRLFTSVLCTSQSKHRPPPPRDIGGAVGIGYEYRTKTDKCPTIWDKIF